VSGVVGVYATTLHFLGKSAQKARRYAGDNHFYKKDDFNFL
jgi:hypothetical protein